MKLKSILSLLLVYILPLLLQFEATQAKNLLLHTLQHINATNSSPWLTRLNNRRPRPPPGCRRQPWICNQGQVPALLPEQVRRRSSDVNNCGLCGIRCRFTRQCCRGLCVNTMRNPNHCGKCDNRCRFPARCMYGLCGYAQPMPPIPFPTPRRPPSPGRRDPPAPCPPRGGGGGRRDHPPRGGGRDNPPAV